MGNGAYPDFMEFFTYFLRAFYDLVIFSTSFLPLFLVWGLGMTIFCSTVYYYFSGTLGFYFS